MRKVTVFALLIVGAALLALLPAITIGQPGGRKGGGGFGGGGLGGGDPNVLFEYYAKGRSYFLISETRTQRDALTAYAQEKGISSGQITRQQFLDFSEQMKAKAGTAPGGASAPPGGGFTPPGGGPGGFGKKKGGGDAGMANADPTALYPFADAEFKRQDANGDGKLVPEEMPRSLKANLQEWDKNGDGFIDIFEYRAYYVARMQGSENASNQGAKGIASIIIDEEDLDRKPVVFRVGGKEPPGLPDWFHKLDTDKDGQVALYEWRVAGKSLEQFKEWDLNDDGFITAEEASKHQASVAKDPTNGSLASSGYDAGAGDRPSMGKGDRTKGGNPFGGGGNPFGGGKGKGKKDKTGQ
jgi:EF hand